MSKWVRVRGKRINLDYAILAEEHDETSEAKDLLPGGVRLTVETGRVIVLPPGPDASTVLRAIDDQIGAPPHDGGSVGRTHDPDTGERLPRQPVEGGLPGGHDLGRDHEA